MNDNNITRIIGSGIRFPIVPNNNKGVATSIYLDRINQSLSILFSTPKGSRLMLPDFGSDIYKYRFDPLDRVLMEKLRYTITEDIRRWEPRIRLNSVEFLTDDHFIENSTLYISIYYSILNTPVTGNYVYPYRLVSYPTNI